MTQARGGLCSHLMTAPSIFFMNPFNNFGIAKRLYAVSFLLIAALVGLAFVAWMQLSEVVQIARSTGTARAPQLQRIGDIELNVTRASLQIRHALLVKTPQDLAATLADIGTRRKAIDESLAGFERALFTAAGRDAFANLPPLAAEFWQVAGANVQLIEAGKKDEAFDFLVAKTIPARNNLLAALDKEKERQSTSLVKELYALEQDAINIRRELIGMVVAVAVGLALFSWHIASVLRRRVADSKEVAERVRDGDLTVAVHDRGRDEFSPLLEALGAMQGALISVVGTVRQNADSVATASVQIAQGNQDLSGRTEEQASALQQTAASMEQLGSTVRQNAQNARHGNQLAIDASSVANLGGEVMRDVVETMKGINESSRKIADIISVIDGIAFQTNILALNAAVEAARAGEQGRGFAVVASEVRNLAQRSAGAAKEIKILIDTSVTQVEHGSSLVDRAGSTMGEVVSAIQKVTAIMSQISLASDEQSSGVGQVGEAVTQMDQATQQNAALVEESAAAADSLKQQAAQLVQAVAVFKLNGGRATHAPDLRPALVAPRAMPMERPVSA